MILLAGEASLLAGASAGETLLLIDDPPEPLLAGETATLAVRAVDAADGNPRAGALIELAPYGLSARSSSDGWAFFDVTQDATGTVAASWTTDGASAGTLLNWTSPRAEVGAPDHAVVGAPASATLRVAWTNGTGVPGAAAGLFLGDELVALATTDALGLATLGVPARGHPGPVKYDVAFDEPHLARAAVSFTLDWELPPRPPNRPPVAVFNVTGDLRPGADIIFDASGSFDPDGNVTSYAWTFSDGAAASGKVVTHGFAADGEVWAALVVSDDERATNHLRRDLFLKAPPAPAPPPPNRPPVATFTVAGDFAPGATLAFDGRGSSDPDGVLRAYAWSFSDGATAMGPVVGHAFAQAGPAWATLTVRDDAEATRQARQDFTIVAPTPDPTPGPEPDPAPEPDPGPEPAPEPGPAPGPAPEESQVVRDLGGRALVQTTEGLGLWDPVQGTVVPVTPAQAEASPPSYQSGALVSSLAVECDGWCLARVEAPSLDWPFEASSDGVSVVAWREGKDLVVLATRGSVLVRFEVPRLQADATAQDLGGGIWRITLAQTAGAPLLAVDARAGDRILARADGPALDAVVRPQPGERVVVTARAASGETFEKDLGVLVGNALEPSALDPQSGQEPGEAPTPPVREAPHPGALFSLAAFAALALALGRRRKGSP